MLLAVLALSGPALAAEPPAVSATLSWTRGLGWVELGPPPGWHVAPDAPSSLGVGALAVSSVGDLSGLRFPLPAGPVVADLGFAVCTDSGTTCIPVRLRASGDTSAAKGQLAFAAVQAVSVTALPSGPTTKVYDFGAVWCPPCNLMNAEVLNDPADSALLAAFEVVPVDVDHHDSWTLKDRYSVGGYPTLVAVDAQGREVARLVGYPGEEATKAWFAGLGSATPLHTLLTSEPRGTPAEIAAVARRLAEGQDDAAARRWLARADDGVDAHIARLLLDGRPEDARWLLAHAPPGSWLPSALTTAPEAWPQAIPHLASLSPVDAADVLSLIADAVEGDQGRAFRAAAVALLRGTMTGDPQHDRAHVTFLADLYDGLGDEARALALLDEYALQFPAEFTFDYAATRLLVDHRRWAQAEARGRVALARAWGDQRLRAVQPLARAIAEQGRMAEAIDLLDAEIARTPVPDEGVDVRTTRYLAQVQALRRELPANVTTK